MGEFVKVATLSDVSPGSAKSVEAGGKSLAVYNVGGILYATTNTCPHRGGPLGEGELQQGVVTCPWHGFQYEVATGKCLTSPALSLPCHRVQVDGEDVLVEV